MPHSAGGDEKAETKGISAGDRPAVLETPSLARRWRHDRSGSDSTEGIDDLGPDE